MIHIPAIISPTFPDALVPAISKVMERYIALSSMTTLGKAIVIKNKDNFCKMFPATTAWERRSGEKTEADEEPSFMIYPKNIAADPTIIRFSFKVQTNCGKNKKNYDIPIVNFFVGFKVYGFKLDNVNNFFEYIYNNRNRSAIITRINKYVKRVIHRIEEEIINYIPKPYDPEKYKKESERRIRNFFNLSWSPKEMRDPEFLSKHVLHPTKSKEWGFIFFLTKEDFKKITYENFLANYSRFVKHLELSDIVILDEKSNLNICTSKTKQCALLDVNYVKKLLALDDVIDSDIFKKTSSFGPIFAGRYQSIGQTLKKLNITFAENNPRERKF